MMIWLSVALAAPPSDARPVLAPSDVQAQYASFLASNGGEAEPLACSALWPSTSVCWRRGKGQGAWVTEAQLASWGDLSAHLAAGRVALGGSTWEPIPADDLGVYFVVPDADGWGALAIMEPEPLASIVDGRVLAAAPVQGTTLVWASGSAELDRAVAVGVQKMHTELDNSVSTVVHRLSEDGWVEFVEAVPR